MRDAAGLGCPGVSSAVFQGYGFRGLGPFRVLGLGFRAVQGFGFRV